MNPQHRKGSCKRDGGEDMELECGSGDLVNEHG